MGGGRAAVELVRVEFPEELGVLGSGDGPLRELLGPLEVVELAHAREARDVRFGGWEVLLRELGLEILLHPLEAVPEDRVRDVVLVVEVRGLRDATRRAFVRSGASLGRARGGDEDPSSVLGPVLGPRTGSEDRLGADAVGARIL